MTTSTRGRPRASDVPYEAPLPGEAVFWCHGDCDRVWPFRLKAAGRSLCPNCCRVYKRGRAKKAGKVRRVRATPSGWEREQRGLQGNACAICAVEFGDLSAAGQGEADHDGRTGLARGILCSPCSAGLHSFGDSAARLIRASEYLKKRSKTDTDVDAHLTRVSSARPATRRGTREMTENGGTSVDDLVERSRR